MTSRSSSTPCARDLHFYPAPFDKLVAPVCPDAKLRKLVRNMLYDGIVAWLLSIDMDEIHRALVKQFGKRKAKAAESELGRRPGRLRIRRQDLHQDRPVPGAAHARQHRQDHHRGQRGMCARCHVRGRHGGHLVSHHALLVAGRNSHRLPETLPHRSGNRPRYFCSGAGRGRTGVHRHGAGRRMGRRAVHDFHRRSRASR